MSQCHARWVSDPAKRCDLEAGHDSLHETRTAWTEEECYDPVAFLSKPFQTPLVEAAPIAAPPPLSTALLPVDDDEPANGQCFSCGCPEFNHPCNEHGCRTFVP